MPDTMLANDLDHERSIAIRTLLRAPLLDSGADPDGFRLVNRHHAWLVDWFETTCGWTLVVDPASGFARLGKRVAEPDPTRPLRRTRGSEAPFDRRRYQLLCLACSELVRHPVTTIGLLAGAITADASLDTARYGERTAFVDALQTLVSWGAAQVSGGDLDAFVESDSANAILVADTTRLHRLLAASIAPSRLADELSTEAATSALLAEPRYGAGGYQSDDAEADSDDERRRRWIRHTLARRLLDDPAVYLDDLSAPEREYLANPAGRKWLRERVASAGFVLEERGDGLVAVDPDATSTDLQFPAPLGNAHQLALLLADRLVPTEPDGTRRLGAMGRGELRRFVDDVLGRFPRWARSHREGDGPDRLLTNAIDLLVAFRLCRREPDGTVVARPALARYRVGEPTISGGAPALFEPDPVS